MLKDGYKTHNVHNANTSHQTVGNKDERLWTCCAHHKVKYGHIKYASLCVFISEPEM